MTYMLVKEIVDSMRLPPNFRIRVDQSYHPNEVLICITASWQDVDGGDTPAQTYSTIVLDPHDRFREGLTNYVTMQVYQSLRLLWFHELHEWFTIDGKHHVEPHPDGRNGPLG